MVYPKTIREKWTPYLLFSVIVATLGGLLFGYHTAVISGALIFLSTAFHLSIADQGVVVSILLIGGIAGAVVAGTMADALGRKKTLLISAVIFILGSLVLGVCQSYSGLLVGRLVCGFAVGVTSLATPLYIAEISPPKLRGSFVSLYQLAVTLGILTSFLVDYLLSVSGNWRLMFMLGALPALIQLVCLFFLGETPPWLFKRGLETQGVALLQRFRRGKNWMNQIDVMKSVARLNKVGTWKTVLSSKMRFVLVIGILLSISQQVTGINTVIYYAPKIFEFSGFTLASDAIAATLVIGIVNVLATLIAVWLLDRVGRRILLLVGVAGMAVSLIALSIAFFLQASWIETVSLLSLMGYVSFFAIGLGPVTWVLLSEIYPLKIRSQAMMIAVVANWSFNYLVSLTFLDLIEGLGPQGTFLLYAAISLVSFWFIFRFIPETRGKSLEEIESTILH